MGEIFLEETKIKLGLFGGTFDPVHNGHIYIAKEAEESHHLDEVHWGPAKHKKHTMFGFKKRRQAVSNLAKKLGHKVSVHSYNSSIEWVKCYNPKKYDIHLIVGKDLRNQIQNWKDFEELRALCKWIWVDRALPISSTMIRERINNKQHIEAFIPCRIKQFM